MRIALALSAAVVGIALVPLPPEVVERWFSARFYPTIQRSITPLSNAIPFALFDVLCIAAAILFLVVIVRALRAAFHVRSIRPLGRAAGLLLTFGAGVYLWFLLSWGLNYRRIPMMERVRLKPSSPSSHDVLRLGMDAAAHLNRLYGKAHAVGWPEEPLEDQSLRSGFDEIQRALSDAPAAVPGRLKQTVFGPYFRWTSVDGMVDPFALEVLANPDLLPFERPFVAAHEWAHLAGYADEAEANFVGWLACQRAGVPAQYSAWLLMYWQVNSELEPSQRVTLGATLGPGPRKDIDAVIARIRRGEWPLLRVAGWQVYDQYLKANRVEEGVRSYGLVVTLLLRATFDEGWLPVRREAVPAGRRPSL